MKVTGATFWAALMVTLVTAKPVCQHVEDDSSNSSESSESMSSEETDVQLRPSQPALTDPGLETEPLDSSLSPSTSDSGAPAAPEDPQTSTDIDPLQGQTALHADSALGAAPDAGMATITTNPKGAEAHEGLQREASPRAPFQVLTPTPLPVSTDTPSTIPTDTPAASLDCFTVRLDTAEPAPPRGDSI